MWDTIQKLKYRADAGLPSAAEALEARLRDRRELPLPGIGGETLYLTGISALQERATQLQALYDRLPEQRGVKDTIILDAYSSATIEGARTTVAQVMESFQNPRTKDDRMVVNTVAASRYAYERPVTAKNIRRLWERVVDGVCENEQHRGIDYRSGMVYIGNASRTIHTPASPSQIPAMMESWFAFRESAQEALIDSFAAHFYFVYVHPYCDGNGRTARILNASQLYHAGYRKMKRLPLSRTINDRLGGYYGSLADAEVVLNVTEQKWLDVSPFVTFMLEAFEQCLIDASLAHNALAVREGRLLDKMKKAGNHARITSAKAAAILECSPDAARAVLGRLCEKGYLTVDMSHTPYVYQLEPKFFIE